jgi:hypothetical protein
VGFNPLSAENNQNFGDILTVPKIWLNPRLTNQIFRTRAVVDLGTVTQSTSAVTGGFNFVLNSVDNSNAFRTIFDSYKIAFLKVKFRPVFTAQNFSSLPTPPLLYTAIDYDNATAPGSIAAIRQYSSCKETRYDKDNVRCFKPRITMGAASSSFLLAANVSQAAWLDCADPNVQHFGLKYVISPALTSSALFMYSIEVEYFLEFRYVI